MTEITTPPERFVEPEAGETAGFYKLIAPKAPYDRFMEREGLPIYREIGVHDVRELELGDWPRLGGRGCYIQLLGTEELWGMYVLEIPPGGALEAERTMYEQVVFVVEGHGTTEVWNDGEARDRFEWQSGSMFALPLNTWHRMINATRERVVMIVGTTAPPVFNLYRDEDFIFDNPYRFTSRYAGGGGDYFAFKDDLFINADRGRAMQVTNFIPDVVHCELPLDNQRSPGYRRIEPNMASGSFYLFVGQHENGRYTKAHHHRARAVLICLTGKGYTYTWPRDLGTTPWEDGNADQVLRQDYVPGGMVAAAPGGGDWFHQHFGVGADPLRLLVFCGPSGWAAQTGGAAPGEEVITGNEDMALGGRSIPYRSEDAHIRREYEAALAAVGVESRMSDDLYQ